MRLESLPPGLLLNPLDLEWAHHRANLWRESNDASFLLLLATAAGLPRPRLVSLYLELIRPHVTGEAATDLLATVTRFLAGEVPIERVTADEKALAAEYAEPARGYDWHSAIAMEAASQALQGHPPEAIAAGQWLADGLAEVLSEEQLQQAAPLVRSRISEDELAPLIRSAA